MRMRKNYLLFIFASILSFAQNTKEFSLVWNNEKPFIVDNTKYIIPEQNNEGDINSLNLYYYLVSTAIQKSKRLILEVL